MTQNTNNRKNKLSLNNNTHTHKTNMDNMLKEKQFVNMSHTQCCKPVVENNNRTKQMKRRINVDKKMLLRLPHLDNYWLKFVAISEGVQLTSNDQISTIDLLKSQTSVGSSGEYSMFPALQKKCPDINLMFSPLMTKFIVKNLFKEEIPTKTGKITVEAKIKIHNKIVTKQLLFKDFELFVKFVESKQVISFSFNECNLMYKITNTKAKILGVRFGVIKTTKQSKNDSQFKKTTDSLVAFSLAEKSDDNIEVLQMKLDDNKLILKDQMEEISELDEDDEDDAQELVSLKDAVSFTKAKIHTLEEKIRRLKAPKRTKQQIITENEMLEKQLAMMNKAREQLNSQNKEIEIKEQQHKVKLDSLKQEYNETKNKFTLLANELKQAQMSRDMNTLMLKGNDYKLLYNKMFSLQKDITEAMKVTFCIDQNVSVQLNSIKRNIDFYEASIKSNKEELNNCENQNKYKDFSKLRVKSDSETQYETNMFNLLSETKYCHNCDICSFVFIRDSVHFCPLCSLAMSDSYFDFVDFLIKNNVDIIPNWYSAGMLDLLKTIKVGDYFDAASLDYKQTVIKHDSKVVNKFLRLVTKRNLVFPSTLSYEDASEIQTTYYFAGHKFDNKIITPNPFSYSHISSALQLVLDMNKKPMNVIGSPVFLREPLFPINYITNDVILEFHTPVVSEFDASLNTLCFAHNVNIKDFQLNNQKTIYVIILKEPLLSTNGDECCLVDTISVTSMTELNLKLLQLRHTSNVTVGSKRLTKTVLMSNSYLDVITLSSQNKNNSNPVMFKYSDFVSVITWLPNPNKLSLFGGMNLIPTKIKIHRKFLKSLCIYNLDGSKSINDLNTYAVGYLYRKFIIGNKVIRETQIDTEILRGHVLLAVIIMTTMHGRLKFNSEFEQLTQYIVPLMPELSLGTNNLIMNLAQLLFDWLGIKVKTDELTKNKNISFIFDFVKSWSAKATQIPDLYNLTDDIRTSVLNFSDTEMDFSNRCYHHTECQHDKPPEDAEMCYCCGKMLAPKNNLYCVCCNEDDENIEIKFDDTSNLVDQNETIPDADLTYYKSQKSSQSAMVKSRINKWKTTKSNKNEIDPIKIKPDVTLATTRKLSNNNEIITTTNQNTSVVTTGETSEQKTTTEIIKVENSNLQNLIQNVPKVLDKEILSKFFGESVLDFIDYFEYFEQDTTDWQTKSNIKVFKKGYSEFSSQHFDLISYNNKYKQTDNKDCGIMIMSHITGKNPDELVIKLKASESLVPSQLLEIAKYCDINLCVVSSDLVVIYKSNDNDYFNTVLHSSFIPDLSGKEWHYYLGCVSVIEPLPLKYYSPYHQAQAKSVGIKGVENLYSKLNGMIMSEKITKLRLIELIDEKGDDKVKNTYLNNNNSNEHDVRAGLIHIKVPLLFLDIMYNLTIDSNKYTPYVTTFESGKPTNMEHYCSEWLKILTNNYQQQKNDSNLQMGSDYCYPTVMNSKIVINELYLSVDKNVKCKIKSLDNVLIKFENGTKKIVTIIRTNRTTFKVVNPDEKLLESVQKHKQLQIMLSKASTGSVIRKIITILQNAENIINNVKLYDSKLNDSMLITGGPGTGKTTKVKSLINANTIWTSQTRGVIMNTKLSNCIMVDVIESVLLTKIDKHVDYLVIDEVYQNDYLTTICLLSHCQPKKVIMMGDNKQIKFKLMTSTRGYLTELHLLDVITVKNTVELKETYRFNKPICDQLNQLGVDSTPNVKANKVKFTIVNLANVNKKNNKIRELILGNKFKTVVCFDTATQLWLITLLGNKVEVVKIHGYQGVEWTRVVVYQGSKSNPSGVCRHLEYVVPALTRASQELLWLIDLPNLIEPSIPKTILNAGCYSNKSEVNKLQMSLEKALIKTQIKYDVKNLLKHDKLLVKNDEKGFHLFLADEWVLTVTDDKLTYNEKNEDIKEKFMQNFNFGRIVTSMYSTSWFKLMNFMDRILLNKLRIYLNEEGSEYVDLYKNVGCSIGASSIIYYDNHIIGSTTTNYYSTTLWFNQKATKTIKELIMKYVKGETTNTLFDLFKQVKFNYLGVLLERQVHKSCVARNKDEEKKHLFEAKQHFEKLIDKSHLKTWNMSTAQTICYNLDYSEKNFVNCELYTPLFKKKFHEYRVPANQAEMLYLFLIKIDDGVISFMNNEGFSVLGYNIEGLIMEMEDHIDRNTEVGVNYKKKLAEMKISQVTSTKNILWLTSRTHNVFYSDIKNNSPNYAVNPVSLTPTIPPLIELVENLFLVNSYSNEQKSIFAGVNVLGLPLHDLYEFKIMDLTTHQRGLDIMFEHNTKAAINLVNEKLKKFKQTDKIEVIKNLTQCSDNNGLMSFNVLSLPINKLLTNFKSINVVVPDLFNKDTKYYSISTINKQKHMIIPGLNYSIRIHSDWLNLLHNHNQFILNDDGSMIKKKLLSFGYECLYLRIEMNGDNYQLLEKQYIPKNLIPNRCVRVTSWVIQTDIIRLLQTYELLYVREMVINTRIYDVLIMRLMTSNCSLNELLYFARTLASTFRTTDTGPEFVKDTPMEIYVNTCYVAYSHHNQLHKTAELLNTLIDGLNNMNNLIKANFDTIINGILMMIGLTDSMFKDLFNKLVVNKMRFKIKFDQRVRHSVARRQDLWVSNNMLTKPVNEDGHKDNDTTNEDDQDSDNDDDLNDDHNDGEPEEIQLMEENDNIFSAYGHDDNNDTKQKVDGKNNDSDFENKHDDLNYGQNNDNISTESTIKQETMEENDFKNTIVEEQKINVIVKEEIINDNVNDATKESVTTTVNITEEKPDNETLIDAKTESITKKIEDENLNFNPMRLLKEDEIKPTNEIFTINKKLAVLGAKYHINKGDKIEKLVFSDYLSLIKQFISGVPVLRMELKQFVFSKGSVLELLHLITTDTTNDINNTKLTLQTWLSKVDLKNKNNLLPVHERNFEFIELKKGDDTMLIIMLDNVETEFLMLTHDANGKIKSMTLIYLTLSISMFATKITIIFKDVFSNTKDEINVELNNLLQGISIKNINLKFNSKTNKYYGFTFKQGSDTMTLLNAKKHIGNKNVGEYSKSRLQQLNSMNLMIDDEINFSHTEDSFKNLVLLSDLNFNDGYKLNFKKHNKFVNLLVNSEILKFIDGELQPNKLNLEGKLVVHVKPILNKSDKEQMSHILNYSSDLPNNITTTEGNLISNKPLRVYLTQNKEKFIVSNKWNNPDQEMLIELQAIERAINKNETLIAESINMIVLQTNKFRLVGATNLDELIIKSILPDELDQKDDSDKCKVVKVTFNKVENIVLNMDNIMLALTMKTSTEEQTIITDENLIEILSEKPGCILKYSSSDERIKLVLDNSINNIKFKKIVCSKLNTSIFGVNDNLVLTLTKSQSETSCKGLLPKKKILMLVGGFQTKLEFDPKNTDDSCVSICLKKILNDDMLIFKRAVKRLMTPFNMINYLSMQKRFVSFMFENQLYYEKFPVKGDLMIKITGKSNKKHAVVVSFVKHENAVIKPLTINDPMVKLDFKEHVDYDTVIAMNTTTKKLGYNNYMLRQGWLFNCLNTIGSKNAIIGCENLKKNAILSVCSVDKNDFFTIKLNSDVITGSAIVPDDWYLVVCLSKSANPKQVTDKNSLVKNLGELLTNTSLSLRTKTREVGFLSDTTKYVIDDFDNVDHHWLYLNYSDSSQLMFKGEKLPTKEIEGLMRTKNKKIRFVTKNKVKLLLIESDNEVIKHLFNHFTFNVELNGLVKPVENFYIDKWQSEVNILIKHMIQPDNLMFVNSNGLLSVNDMQIIKDSDLVNDFTKDLTKLRKTEIKDDLSMNKSKYFVDYPNHYLFVDEPRRLYKLEMIGNKIENFSYQLSKYKGYKNSQDKWNLNINQIVSDKKLLTSQEVAKLMAIDSLNTLGFLTQTKKGNWWQSNQRTPMSNGWRLDTKEMELEDSINFNSTIKEKDHAFHDIVTPELYDLWENLDQSSVVELHNNLATNKMLIKQQPTRLMTITKELVTNFPKMARPYIQKLIFTDINCTTKRLFGAQKLRKNILKDWYSNAESFCNFYFKKGWGDICKIWAKEPLVFNYKLTLDWLEKAKYTDKIKRELFNWLEKDIAMHNHSEVHITTKMEAVFKEDNWNNVADQNPRIIVWPHYKISAIVSPLFKIIKSRIKLLLSDKFYYTDGLTPEEINKVINTDKISDNLFESDLSKQDRQTDQDLLGVEMYIYQILGLEPQICQWWSATHGLWKFKTRFFSGFRKAMRQTGTPTTAVGNVITNMQVHKPLLQKNEGRFNLALFLGDDNLILSKGKMNTDRFEKSVKDNFNMLIKLKQSDESGKYCSFTIYKNIDGRWSLGPDFIKLKYKFELTNGVSTVDQELVNTRRMSYLMNLGDNEVTREIITADNLPIKPTQWFNEAACNKATAKNWDTSVSEVERHKLDLLKYCSVKNYNTKKFIIFS